MSIGASGWRIASAIVSDPDYQVFLSTANDGSKTHYTAAEINASLATAAGSMWKAVIIGGQDIDTAIAEAAAQIK